MVQIHVAWLVLAGFILFTIGYFGYSKYLSTKVFELDDARTTPAHKYQDGQEYVPAKKPVLLGHHWASISGAAPAVGPITAALIWGWLPALLWIIIGNPLMGAVHDFSALTSSVRHEGKSIGYVIGEYVGERGKDMLLWFAFLLLILVVAVFAIVLAVVFHQFPQTATAGMIYIGLAILFGLWLYQFNLNFIAGTVIFVAAVFVGVWVGIQFPVAFTEPGQYADQSIILFGELAFLPELFGSTNVTAWILVSLVYSFFASVLPVWFLLQPRDYLSSFLMYTGIGGALLAIFVAAIFATSAEPLVIHPDISAFYGFWGSDLVPIAMPLFPLLFVTIACGTISGAHSLVSSGTTGKQLDKETDAQLIGYGGMLLEGLYAIVAMATVIIIAAAPAAGGIALALPNFAAGGGMILTALGVPLLFGTIFMALVLSAFVLTTMDTVVRIARYMLEEIIGTPESTPERWGANMYISSGLVVIVGYLLIQTGQWETLWLLFGGANQLLAALALLAATVWLANWDTTKQLLSTGGAMAVMAVVTIVALAWLMVYQIAWLNLLDAAWMAEAGAAEIISAFLQLLLAGTLIALAIGLIWIGWGNIKEVRPAGQRIAADGGDTVLGDEEPPERGAQFRHVKD